MALAEALQREGPRVELFTALAEWSLERGVGPRDESVE
jgi:hypothetical protein